MSVPSSDGHCIFCPPASLALTAEQFYWKIFWRQASTFFFFSVVAALISHWLTHKTLCVFTADGNKANLFQAHQPGDLAGARNPQPDWRVVSLLILQAPIGMGSVCDACEMQARGRLGLAVSILTLQAIFWQHAGSLFILLLWLVSLA